MPRDNAPRNRTARAGNTADVAWAGLANLTPAHREELANRIVPEVASHLEHCLRITLEDWKAGRISSEATEASWVWAHDLGVLSGVIVREFTEAITDDIKTTRYPPQYEFSGIAYASGNSDLSVLNDYQSSRRSLRHELEAVVRSHRYSSFLLTEAAREGRRFQYPNWAPWAPLHWFERLIETVERHFERKAKTLELMQSYVHNFGKTGGPVLAVIVETVDALGLAPNAAESFQREGTPEPKVSWAALTRDDHPSTQGPSRIPSASPQPGRDSAPGSTPGRLAPPAEGADAAQWQQWVRNMAQVIARGGAENTGTGDLAGGALTSLGTTGESGIQLQVIRGDVVSSAAAEDQDDVSRASLTPFILDLLQGMFDHVFRQIGFNARVRAAIGDMQYALARVVIRDLGFFRDRSHPLRLWIGSLINTGLRISPEGADAEHEVIDRYMECIEGSVNTLRAEADSMDREGAQDLLDDWLKSIEGEHSLWEDQHEAKIQPLRQEEHIARAWRALTVCVVETGATLPREAADKIAAAWADILLMEDAGTGTLSDNVKTVVMAICRRAPPLDVNPLVNRLVTDALETGLSEEGIRSVVSRLGQAHLQHSRAGEGTERFDPQEQIQQRRSVRFADDDPDLTGDLDDDFLFDATRARVGDWFGFTDRATGDTRRMALIWRGEATRSFLFLSLDGVSKRRHSLQGMAHEMREGRMRQLPRDNPLDAMIR